MTVGIVNEMGRSRSGTPKLKIDGRWYVAGRMNLDGIQPGGQVEYIAGSFAGQDGKHIACINQIRPSGPPPMNGGYAPQQYQPPAQMYTQSAYPAQPPKPQTDADELRFVSNCVGQAIAAGTIKVPGDIGAWFRAAQRALRGAPEERIPGSDDEPPFNDDIP